MKYIHILLTLSVLLLASCSKKTQTPTSNTSKDNMQARMDNMAKELCECSKDFLKLMEDVDKYVKEKNVEELKRIDRELVGMKKKMAECMDYIEKKYPEIGSPETEKAAMKSLKKYCPEMAKVAQLGKASQ